MAIVRETGTQTTNQASGTSITITKPTGLADNDVMVAMIGYTFCEFSFNHTEICSKSIILASIFNAVSTKSF